jgi:hypothetical protein
MKDKAVYNILLLLTDGVIGDMPETKRLIVQLSAFPCSIIIIGVGGANFSQMHELDGDDGILRDDTGRCVVRDVVQFVEFKKSVIHGNLAEEVLKEIPN